MFIYNVKVNGSKLFKLFFTAIIVLVICILCFVTFRVFGGASKEVTSADMSCIPQNSISNISSNNYTNILKAVHDDIDSYVGVKIHFTGYVYRLADFTDTQFVLARDMVISSDFQTVVVVIVKMLKILKILRGLKLQEKSPKEIIMEICLF